MKPRHALFIAGYSIVLASSVALAAEPAERYEPAGQPPAGTSPDHLGLQGSFVSTDPRIPRDKVFASADGQKKLTFSVTAWRGERVNAQIALWSTTGFERLRLETKRGGLFPQNVQTRFVRYTRGADGVPCGDILDTAERIDLPVGTTRPVWISIEVPRDALPGPYQIPVTVVADGGIRLPFLVKLDVLHATLPVPHDWSFHLDLWQNPYAIARYHRVKPWSPEHFAILEPHMKMLANAGEKVLTASIVHQPWGTQTYDPYESMIEWIQSRDGTWHYDYSAFDKWVEFGARCGIDHQINCYSLIPWSDRFRYLDEASGDYRTVEAVPGSPAYEAHLRPFLKDFEQHLKKKGWLGKTHVAMDERPMPVMQKLLAFLKQEAPGLKVASAANYSSELSEEIADLSIAIGDTLHLTPEALRKRSASGHHTTFYVCCVPNAPNTFTSSPPAEAEWLPLYGAARSFDGLLRWAFDSWVADPLQDTAHVNWPPGDCFMVYPGARSSVRFERLREGIEGFEKIRILRAAAARPVTSPAFLEAVKKLETVLSGLRIDPGKVEADVRAVRAAMAAASVLMPH